MGPVGGHPEPFAACPRGAALTSVTGGTPVAERLATVGTQSPDYKPFSAQVVGVLRGLFGGEGMTGLARAPTPDSSGPLA